MSNCNAKQSTSIVKTIDKECEWCHKPFKAIFADHKRGRARFCSVKCSGAFLGKQRTGTHIGKWINITCAYCGKTFEKLNSRLPNSRSGLYFCCREHKDLAQRIGGIKEIQPSHYHDDYQSYRSRAEKAFEYKCKKCGYDELPILQVHHIDSNRNNNNIDNLEYLCPTCHEIIHYEEKTGRYAKRI